MKHVLEFDLPEERYESLLHSRGPDYYLALSELAARLARDGTL